MNAAVFVLAGASGRLRHGGPTPSTSTAPVGFAPIERYGAQDVPALQPTVVTLGSPPKARYARVEGAA